MATTVAAPPIHVSVSTFVRNSKPAWLITTGRRECIAYAGNQKHLSEGLAALGEDLDEQERSGKPLFDRVAIMAHTKGHTNVQHVRLAREGGMWCATVADLASATGHTRAAALFNLGQSGLLT